MTRTLAQPCLSVDVDVDAAVATHREEWLTASRARVVVAADETRRRLQHDLHHGAQARLAHTVVALKLARDALATGQSAADLIDEALAHAEQASRELGGVVRGILPTILVHGGLRPGVESLIAGLALAAEVRVAAPRLPAATETAAYFVVAEALTNVAAHACADRVRVSVELEGRFLTIEVSDDGVGGADPTRGRGLTGLVDRVEAVGGVLTIMSRAGAGTVLRAVLPVDPP
jgi:signal transduction histidine kinase